ncbi:MAG: serine/threonine-protein phosphatase [Desertifilum sp.]|nr:PP2C family serine/threonine-protein phosphatase [Oscillatoria laete-virens]MCD8488077.1 serine/threonine-protein phosphatase [Desertifilum sp.]MDL5052363.1 serine/threonine-protein phosphatase [Oscillatoria laete-virens NRMC-F 0139]
MKRLFTGQSDTGLVRPVNQDSFYYDPEGRFFIVADGMGGHAGGQEASRIAADTIKNYLLERWDSEDESGALLEAALLKANQAILLDQNQHPERSDMGTTVVVLIFREADLQPWCAHVGDSRLYRLRGPHLEQITEDHTWVARAMKEGILTPDQARVHPWRHVLSQCLGREDLGQVEIQQFEVQTGDRLLMCSDGLTEELSDLVIAQNLKGIRACEKAAEELILAAKKHGGRDNITVVLISIGSDSNAD